MCLCVTLHNNCYKNLPNSFSKLSEALTESGGGVSIKGNVLGSTPAAIRSNIVDASGHLKRKQYFMKYTNRNKDLFV